MKENRSFGRIEATKLVERGIVGGRAVQAGTCSAGRTLVTHEIGLEFFVPMVERGVALAIS